MAGRFSGKVALVTGGSSGIGFATARRLALEGARVAIAARRRDVGDEAVERIRSDGGDAWFVQSDMSDASSIEAMTAATVERFGRLDVAFNNAGIPGSTNTPISAADDKLFDRVMSVNVRGVYLCIKHQFRVMDELGGVILICGSAAGVRGGFGGAAAYYTSKHALMGLTKQAAMDGAPRKIRVNAILPGMVRTDLVARAIDSNPERIKSLSAQIPMRRPAEPEEIAAAAAFLCSEDASYITGTALSVDGGLTI